MHKLLIFLLFFVFLFSCHKKKTLSSRLELFYETLREIEIENFTEKSGYLIEAFEKGDITKVERSIDLFCFKKAIAEEISVRILCPKLEKLKKQEFIDFLSPRNTVLYFHKYFFQKIKQNEKAMQNEKNL